MCWVWDDTFHGVLLPCWGDPTGDPTLPEKACVELASQENSAMKDASPGLWRLCKPCRPHSRPQYQDPPVLSWSEPLWYILISHICFCLKVFIVLCGENGHSETKELCCPEKPLFGRNSRHTFILRYRWPLQPHVWGKRLVRMGYHKDPESRALAFWASS